MLSRSDAASTAREALLPGIATLWIAFPRTASLCSPGIGQPFPRRLSSSRTTIRERLARDNSALLRRDPSRLGHAPDKPGVRDDLRDRPAGRPVEQLDGVDE